MPKGKVIWLTGLPCSGKTTIAKQLLKYIPNSIILDGDDIRSSPISDDLGFSREDRNKNILRVGYIAKLLSSKGSNVICAFISPYSATRKKIRELIGENFIEVYVKATPEVCQGRDNKGMWAKARKGKIKEFTGISNTYEPPEKPEIICETANEMIIESTEKVLSYLNNTEARAFYIGRFQPFHEGHDFIIKQSLHQGIPVLIGIRDTYPDPDNPLPAEIRKKMIEDRYRREDVKVIIIPNIKSINIGRKVGYDIIKINAPEEIENISASKIRGKK